MVSVLFLLTSGPALAWNAEVGIDRLEDYFYVDSFSGSHTWTTLREGIRADSGVGSIPNNNIVQSWDGAAWPSDVLTDSESDSAIIAKSDLEHYDGVSDEFFDYAQSFVFGDIPAGEAYGGAWFYDFELTLDPSAMASVFLDDSGAYGDIESAAGDDGTAFISISLYAFDAGINDPGGVNDPYAQDSLFLISPPTDGLVDSPLGFSHNFTNPGATSLTFNLRLEGRVSVFESAVPEPGSLALCVLGGLGLLLLRRRV